MSDRRDNRLLICQHNILAPIWVAPEYSLLPCSGSFLDPHRQSVTTDYLIKLRADIYCLCEVQGTAVDSLSIAFPEHDVFFAANEPGYWSEWLSEDMRGESTTNGTCVLLRRGRFERCEATALSLGDGCVCCVVTCQHISSDMSMLVVSIHFDVGNRKWLEAASLLSALSTHYLPVGLTVIAGDYNSPDVSAFYRSGYKEYALRADSTPLYQGMIDHTLLLSRDDLEAFGRVLSIPRDRPTTMRGLVSGICETVSTNGSDHFATVTLVKLPRRTEKRDDS